MFPVLTDRVGIGWWTLLKQLIFPPYVIDSLDDKSTMLASTSKMPSLPLHVGTHLKEELNAYCFALKATRVFPISTQAE